MEFTKNLPMFAAVTSIDTPTGTKILGLGVSGYDDTPDQAEYLANPNFFDCNIDERSKHRGDRQSFLTDYGEIPINLEEDRLPYTYIREPTIKEIQT